MAIEYQLNRVIDCFIGWSRKSDKVINYPRDSRGSEFNFNNFDTKEGIREEDKKTLLILLKFSYRFIYSSYDFNMISISFASFLPLIIIVVFFVPAQHFVIN